MSRKTLIAASLLAFSLVAHAQDNPLGTSPACGPAQEGNPDSRSPHAVVQALYEIVSGPAGARKDWERMDRLFAPGAVVTPTSHRAPGCARPPGLLIQGPPPRRCASRKARRAAALSRICWRASMRRSSSPSLP